LHSPHTAVAPPGASVSGPAGRQPSRGHESGWAIFVAALRDDTSGASAHTSLAVHRSLTVGHRSGGGGQNDRNRGELHQRSGRLWELGRGLLVTPPSGWGAARGCSPT